MNVDLKAMLDDVRGRDAALMQLLLFNDRQAMSLFRIYVTIGIAAAAGAATGFIQASDTLLAIAKWGLLASTFFLGLGSFFCLQAMPSASLGLPGRSANFWLWAAAEDIHEQHVKDKYLAQAAEAQKRNLDLNTRSAKWLKAAKVAGLSAPLIGLLVALAVASGTIDALTVSPRSSCQTHPAAAVAAVPSCHRP